VEYLKRLEKPSLIDVMKVPRAIPNGKTDTNNMGPFSSDYIGASWDYPDGDYVTRQKIWKDHVDYTKGLLYFLTSAPRVPVAIRTELGRWGLAKDEFVDESNWPHQLYIREGRRMVGEYVMTQPDVVKNTSKPDAVGMGSYGIDCHHVQRVVDRDGNVKNEGNLSGRLKVDRYEIPYRSLLPKKMQCENLLVPVCVSASHVAYGSIRMEPVYMILGHAAGAAAAIAVKRKSSVHEVGIGELQQLLLDKKAIIKIAHSRGE